MWSPARRSARRIRRGQRPGTMHPPHYITIYVYNEMRSVAFSESDGPRPRQGAAGDDGGPGRDAMEPGTRDVPRRRIDFLLRQLREMCYRKVSPPPSSTHPRPNPPSLHALLVNESRIIYKNGTESCQKERARERERERVEKAKGGDFWGRENPYGDAIRPRPCPVACARRPARALEDAPGPRRNEGRPVTTAARDKSCSPGRGRRPWEPAGPWPRGAHLGVRRGASGRADGPEAPRTLCARRIARPRPGGASRADGAIRSPRRVRGGGGADEVMAA